MSEHNPMPADVADLNWGYAATPYTITKPDGAKREIGWQPKDESPPGVSNPGTPGEIIPAAIHNWLLNTIGEAKDWLASKAVRMFTEVHEAITDGIENPDTFKLYVSGEQHYPMGVGSYTAVAGSAYTINEILTDGCNLYFLMQYLGAGKSIIAVHPDAPGTALWTHTATTSILCVACDGRYVYVGDSGVAGVQVLDADTGTLLLTYDPVTPDVDSPVRLACNGRMVAVIDATTNDVIEILSVSVPTPPAAPVMASVSQVDLTGSTDIKYCLHGNVLYVVHTTAIAEAHIAAYKIDVSPSTVIFDVNLTTLWTGGASGHNAIACDGDRVYLATDVAEPEAGLTGAVHAFDMVTGTRLWTATLGATRDGVSLSLSAGLVWVGAFDTPDYFLHRLGTMTGEALGIFSGPDTGYIIASDELCVYMRVGSDVTKFARVWRGGPAVEMQVVHGYDIWRTPNKHRAVPVR